MKAIKDNTTGRWDLEGVEDSKVTYGKILTMLQAKVPFSFSRWGDGEFNAILGNNPKNHNCDMHEYFSDMGERLQRILWSFTEYVKPQPYIMGLQPLSLSHSRALEVQKLIDGLNIKWVNADTLHNASIDERLKRFFEVLKTRKVVLIGPKHLEFFKTTHLVIPDLNCWKVYEGVKEQVNKFIWQNPKENVIFLLCASMMSEVLIHDFKDVGCTFIDCGSVLDPYAGVKSRSYHYKMEIS